MLQNATGQGRGLEPMLVPAVGIVSDHPCYLSPDSKAAASQALSRQLQALSSNTALATDTLSQGTEAELAREVSPVGGGKRSTRQSRKYNEYLDFEVSQEDQVSEWH